MKPCFRYHGTDELLEHLRAAAARLRSATRIGASFDDAAQMMSHAYATAADVSQTAMRAALDTAHTPFGWAYARIQGGAMDLASTAKGLQDAGFGLEARMTDELAVRAHQFAQTFADNARTMAGGLGEGLGAAYRNFFGFPPIVGLLAGLLILGGAGYLLLTPGGQALLTGSATAIGTGGTQVLVGGGKALGSLAIL